MSIKFIHNVTTDYRVPFFRQVSDEHDVEFLFTHTDSPAGLEKDEYEVLGRDPSFVLQLAKEVADDEHDVVVNCEPGGLTSVLWTVFIFVMAKVSGKKHVLWSERYEPPKWSVRFAIMHFIYKIIIPRSDACFVPGLQHREYMLKLGASPESVFLVPNVSNLTQVDRADDDPDSIRQQLGIEDKHVVLYAGRIDRAKGLQYLIPAFDEVRRHRDDVALVIVGSGYYESKIKELYEEHETEDTYFVGWVDNEELPNYYMMADIFVHPSIQLISRRGGSIGDAYGLVFNEAAHFGLPVIGTDAAGASHDVVRNGENGFVVPQRDSEALSEKIEALLSDDEMREAMGRRSKEIVENSRSYRHMFEGFDHSIKYVQNQ